jgi:hypothetical protein
MKHYHAEVINRAVRLGDTKFPRAEFLSAFDGIRKDTFKKTTIHSAFRKTGLIPFNPNVVIERMREKGVTPRQITPPPHFLTLHTTPQKPQDIAFQAKVITQLVKHWKLPEEDKILLRKYVKGSLALTLSGAEASHNLLIYNKALAERAARKKKGS